MLGSDTTSLLKGGQMRHRAIATLGAVAVLVALVSLGAAPAGAQTAAVRTAWDAPNLRDIWDFRTITPLERPDELADKTFLTEEEAVNLEQEVIDRNARLLARTAERTTAADQVDRREDGTPGFYNNFWLDQGTRAVDTRRTSLIDHRSAERAVPRPDRERPAEGRREPGVSSGAPCRLLAGQNHLGSVPPGVQRRPTPQSGRLQSEPARSSRHRTRWCC